jgi:hypothetical protein
MYQSTRHAFLVALSAMQIAVPARADDVLLASLPVGDCALRVEMRTQEPNVLLVRASHPHYAGCQIDEASLRGALGQALSNPVAQQARYSSVFLGRLVDYPWLSTYLARAAAADPAWSPRAGKPARGDVNGYVGALLSRPVVTDRIQPPLEAGGYRIAGASVEKVLISPARELPGLGEPPVAGRLPFDAMFWLRLQPR